MHMQYTDAGGPFFESPAGRHMHNTCICTYTSHTRMLIHMQVLSSSLLVVTSVRLSVNIHSICTYTVTYFYADADAEGLLLFESAGDHFSTAVKVEGCRVGAAKDWVHATAVVLAE